MQQKPFVWDAKMKHRVELLTIILIITVLGNIGVYYYNKNYEKNTAAQAKMAEIARRLTPTPTLVAPSPLVTDVPPATQAAILRDCTIYKTTDYTLCLPKNWTALVKSPTEVQFQPKSVPASPTVNYLTISVTTLKISPLPTPVQTYTTYKTVIVGTSTGYRAAYIPQKTKDGFDIPLPSGCQDPVKILVPSGKKTLVLTTCQQYEEVIKALLASLLLSK